MVGVPNRFITGTPFLINFDWTDSVTGLGFITFKGYATTDSAGTNYVLGRNEVYSDPIATEDTATEDGTFQLLSDLDFDTETFKKPLTAKGTATINLSFSCNGDDSSGYVVVTIYHYDGSTETSIGTATTATMTGGDDEPTQCIDISLTEKTFAIGDLLRLNLKGYVKGATPAAGDLYISIGHDPQNRDWDASTGNFTDLTSAAGETTKLDFHMPFKVNE